MDYPPTTLTTQKGKLYVLCTVPRELRDAFGGRRQIKRSTGTSDPKVAKQKQHQIADDVYQAFDEALNDPDRSLREGAKLLESLIASPEDIQRIVERDLDQRMRQAALGLADGAFLYSEAAKSYIEKNDWNRFSTKRAVKKAIAEFLAFAGDLPVNQITKKHAYDFARDLMEKNGFSNSTIKNRVSFAGRVLQHAEVEGHLDNYPWSNLSLSSFGAKKVHWEKIEDDQLHKLFKLPLPEHVDLLFTILLTTGMRLDEAALLTYDDIKEERGILYFDLTEKIVKNMGSKRKVPIVPEVKKKLKEGSGRLFPMFNLDRDGKAQTDASRKSIKYLKKITTSDRQVLHSLRGTFKDLMRDTGCTEEMHNFITGHSLGDAAGKYGSGPSLKARYDAMIKAKHPWLGS